VSLGQAGVQMPLGQTSAPAGDFEAEYRGSMEHAESTVQAHVAQAIASKKVGEDQFNSPN